MNGNNKMIIQSRDLHILRTISLLRAIDRKQAMAIGKFGSVTRVNATMLRLVKAGLLNRFFLGVGPGTQKAIYTVSPKGASVADVPYRRFRRKNNGLYSGDIFLEHQLLLNDIYISLHLNTVGVKVQNWKTFEQALPQSSVRPDAYFELSASGFLKAVFLEVDRGTEPKKTWKKKVASYLSFALQGSFEKLFQHSQFRVLVITTTDLKLKRIKAVVSEHTNKVFYLSTFEDINREGIFSSVWQRPTGEEKHSLI